MIDRVVPGLEANYVGVKDEDLGELATSHLIGLGCKRIAHIRGPNVSTGVDRLQGYRNALNRRKIPVRKEYIVSGQHGDSTGYDAMLQLLKNNPAARWRLLLQRPRRRRRDQSRARTRHARA